MSTSTRVASTFPSTPASRTTLQVLLASVAAELTDAAAGLVGLDIPPATMYLLVAVIAALLAKAMAGLERHTGIAPVIGESTAHSFEGDDPRPEGPATT